MTSFDVMATVTCDIKRVGPTVGGWEPSPTVIYSGVACLEPYPVKPELKFYLGVKPATKLFRTVIEGSGYVIEENDLVVIASGIEYPIVTAEEWYIRPRNTTYVILTMEAK